jgi:hypothetical protein
LAQLPICVTKENPYTYALTMDAGHGIDFLAMSDRHINPRARLRLRDLKQANRPATRLLNVKVPQLILERIAQVSTQLGASKTEVIVALLNEGLNRASRVVSRTR